MGKGRKPTPAGILKLTGTFRDDRHGNRLDVPPSDPVCPDDLNEDERREWQSVFSLLSTFGILSAVDAGQLARYARLKVAWNELDYRDKMSERIALSRELGRIESEFGMTPAARCKLKTENKKTQAGVMKRAR